MHTGDQYLGRVLAGLPVHSKDFAALPPHFTDPEHDAIQKGLDVTFGSGPTSIQGKHPGFIPVLRMCKNELARARAESSDTRIRCKNLLLYIPSDL